jgi:hypothetical protein
MQIKYVILMQAQGYALNTLAIAKHMLIVEQIMQGQTINLTKVCDRIIIKKITYE